MSWKRSVPPPYLDCLVYSVCSVCSVRTVLMERSQGLQAREPVLHKNGLTEIGYILHTATFSS